MLEARGLERLDEGLDVRRQGAAVDLGVDRDLESPPEDVTKTRSRPAGRTNENATRRDAGRLAVVEHATTRTGQRARWTWGSHSSVSTNAAGSVSAWAQLLSARA